MSHSVGICTPIPLVPVDSGVIVKEKLRQAKAFLDSYGALRVSTQTIDTDPHTQVAEARRLLEEALTAPASGDKHLGLITPEWQRARTALAIPPGHAQVEVYADGMEVGAARNAAVQYAREAKLKYLMFIDWDTLIPADALVKLSYFLDNNPDFGVASGMYCMKSMPPFPLLWRDWNKGVDFDWTMGDLIKERVVGIPMGCCLLRLDLFDKLPTSAEKPWFKTVDEPVLVGGTWGRMMMTEDLWFTKRFTDECQGKIAVDTSVWCEHICHATGRRYTLGEDALPMKRLREKEIAETPKTVLHVGCGTAALPKDEFTGWREWRLDIDERVKPDVVGTLTALPIADGYCDAVYSSHNVEHLFEHEVPVALKEFARVLKPGGELVMAVPDVQEVFEKVTEVGLDTPLYESSGGPICGADILWGWRKETAQGNAFYGHKTGFTEGRIKNLLAAAGFLDVVVKRGNFALSVRAKK